MRGSDGRGTKLVIGRMVASVVLGWLDGWLVGWFKGGLINVQS